MRKKQKQQVTIILTVVGLTILSLLLNVMDKQNLIGGDWTTLTSSLFDYFPHLVGIALGFVLVIKDQGNRSTTPIRLMLLTSMIGFVFASLFYEMYNDSIWVDDIITATYTITDFQFTIILFFFLLGILLGLVKKR